jgi:hypothetical protein
MRKGHPTKNLTLRSERSERLEGWDTALVLPTLRDAALRAAPQGEAVRVDDAMRS